jgi:hypothetical protein
MPRVALEHLQAAGDVSALYPIVLARKFSSSSVPIRLISLRADRSAGRGGSYNAVGFRRFHCLRSGLAASVARRPSNPASRACASASAALTA